MTERDRRPHNIPSDEANEEQLHLAHDQGQALGKAIKHMTEKEAHGEERVVGDYLVGYAVEDAEGMYRRDGERLIWQDPTNENAHIEVVVRDAADGRFIPGLTVLVTVSSIDGKQIGAHEQPFLWHPWLHHYGRNWTLPGDGAYNLRIDIDPPTFMRHDKKNGNRFNQPVTVEFTNVKIETGQKMSS